MDAARKWTDRELEALERRMASEYAQAAREMRDKQQKWLASFEREREMREKALDSTKEAMEAHRKWLESQASRGRWIDSMANQLAESASKSNVKAMEALNGALPRIYAENANMAAFSIDRALKADTGFTLVNEDAVRHLMGLDEHTPLIHEVIDVGPTQYTVRNGEARRLQSLVKDVDTPRDIAWNRQKFTSAITQGVLQGESIPNIVKRTESIYGMNMAAATRAVRTAVTGAENMGRKMSYERAVKLGIDMEITWQATLDERTRESHRELDGQTIHVGETFSNGLEYPGDPAGEPEETYNCRCRYEGRVVGFDGERGDWAEDAEGERWARLPKDMTYQQWKDARPKTRAESYMNPVGRVSAQWYANSALEAVSAAQTVAYAADSLHPSEINGVQRTAESMTFEDADGGKGNPRYRMHDAAWDEYQKAWERYMSYGPTHVKDFSAAEEQRLRSAMLDAKARYEAAQKARQPYTVNCQSCVVANEARRRGYDVMATGNVRGSVNEMVARDTARAWIDPATGKKPKYIKYEGPGTVDAWGDTIPTRAQYWKWLDSEGVIEEGNRYTIEFAWKGRSRSGHIVCLERTDGKLRMFDPQNGEIAIGDDFKAYLGDVKYSSTSYGTKYENAPKVLRIDNLEFNPDVMGKIMEARE